MAEPPPRAARRARLWPLLFPLAALLLLWPLTGNRVLLPAEQLAGMSPWRTAFSQAQRDELPQWNVLQWDGMAEFYPWRLHLARSLHSGHLPLWNPAVLCGTPFLANSQAAPLYPPHWLLVLAPTTEPGPGVARLLGVLAWLHLSLAGWFTFLLAGYLGARPAAAALGGLAFELSGFAVAWLELPSFLAVACWLPLATLLLLRTAARGSVYTALAAGLTLGLMLLAGHLQIALYGLLWCAGWWLWGAVRAAREAGGWGTLRRAGALGLLAGALGLALAAPQLLPSLELSRFSHRASPPSEGGYAGYVSLALPPRNWVTLLAPDFYGLPQRRDFWGQSAYGGAEPMEYAGWVGAAALLLALAGVGAALRMPAVPPLAAWWLLALLLATGTPLCRLLYFGIPGFAQSGSPARALVLACLAQALLAALGAESLLARTQRQWRAALPPLAGATAAFLALLAGTALVAFADAEVARFARLAVEIGGPALARTACWAAGLLAAAALMAWLLRENRPEHREAAFGGALLTVTAAGLLWLGGDYNATAPVSMVYPPTRATELLRALPDRVATLNREWRLDRTPAALLPPNSSLAYGWRDVQGYDSLYLGHFRRLMNAVNAPEDASPSANGNMVFLKHAASPLRRVLAARYLLSENPLSAPGLEPGAPAGDPPYLYLDTTALPEAYLATGWQAAHDDDQAVRLLRAQGTRAGVPPVVSGAAGPAPEALPTPAAVNPVLLARPAPGRLAARLPGAAPGAPPRLLVVAEGYHPGWRAVTVTSDGARHPTPVLRSNLAFLGVRVPADAETVWLAFEPASFRAGLFLALLALAAAVGAAVALRGGPGGGAGEHPLQ